MRNLYRFMVAFLIAFVAVVPSLAIPVAAQNLTSPVVEEVDITFRAPNLTRQCGFKVYVNVVGTLTFQANPSGMELTHYRLHHIFSGPGGSMTVKRSENEKIVWTTAPDGTSIATITYSGSMMYHTVLPGYGSLANNSGHEVLEVHLEKNKKGKWVVISESWISDSGPNDSLSADDYAVICGVLD